MEDKIQRLSEGMDFIEESTGMSSEPLSFSETDSVTISEASSAPSSYKVLGTARGCFAPINEFSRNRRLYSQDLWPTVLQNEELKSRLARRSVFGCLGHADKLVDDRDIQEGKVSHIVTLLEVRNDQKTGKPYLYGELEILDTPAGRILEAMYKGGANLYVSSRAAGKLIPVPGQNYSMVKPDQYHMHTFDIVCRPGFLQAHPMFEGVATNESMNEEVRPLKLSNKMVEIDISKKKNETEDEDDNREGKETKSSNEELTQLKSQLNQLTKIIEKVVDDVYEDEDQPATEAEEKIAEMLFDPSISEEIFEELENVLSDSNPELLQKVMENSRNKFNDEHAEKSGLKIDYYRFGGNKPYKIVPKDSSYFEASWSSPRYRTLKQAQKHVLDSYNKPKEEKVDKNESLAQVALLLSDSTISESSLVDILELLIKKEDK